jgi:hypothetical protein
MKIIILSLFTVTLLSAQYPSLYSRETARPSEPWVKNGIIYEIYPRAFSKEGNFAGIEKKLPELKKLGVTILWLMPIHPVGTEKRKGSLGSPYSIKDYYGINPEFGTLDDFKRLVKSTHTQGFKIVIDLVANHTSWDSKMFNEHPEWFTKDSSGKVRSARRGLVRCGRSELRQQRDAPVYDRNAEVLGARCRSGWIPLRCCRDGADRFLERCTRCSRFHQTGDDACRRSISRTSRESIRCDIRMELSTASSVR